MVTQTLTLQISRRPDGQFVTMSQASVLATDISVGKAIASAIREGITISRERRCRVVIAIQQPGGQFRDEQIINPPVKVRQNPRPSS
jgi:hypothetical protein